jgi:hypothetical protein
MFTFPKQTVCLHFKHRMAKQFTIMDSNISQVNGKQMIVFAAPIWFDPTQDKARKTVGVVNTANEPGYEHLGGANA